MPDFDLQTIIASIAITWGIGLAPPLVIRYAILKRPMHTWPAIGTTLFFWFFNFFLFTVLGSRSKSHGALVLVAGVSYWLLKRAGTTKEAPSMTPSVLPKTPPVQSHAEVHNQPSQKPAAPLANNFSKTVLPKSHSTMPLQTIVDEEPIYAEIAKELETGVAKKGLWTRLYAECGGDETQTKVLYIKQRADQLISAERLRLQQVESECTVEAERVEKLRLPPTDAQQMEEYGITFDGERYNYTEYKYDKLSDAISYAKLQKWRSA